MRILMRLSFFTSYVASFFLVLTLLMAVDATAVRYNERGEPIADDLNGKGSRPIARPNSPVRNQQQSVPDQSGAAAATAGASLLQVRNDQDDEKAPAAPLGQMALLEYQLKKNKEDRKAFYQLEGIIEDQNKDAIKRLEAEFLLHKFQVLPVRGYSIFMLAERDTIPAEMRAQARLYRVRLICLQLLNTKDDAIDRHITQVSQDTTLPQVIRDEADFFLAALEVIDEKHTGKTFSFLTQVSKNKELPQWMRDAANFFRGMMCALNTDDFYHGKMMRPKNEDICIDDEEGFKLLADASENNKLSLVMQDHAEFLMGMMRAHKRTKAIDTRKASMLLAKASKDSILFRWMRDENDTLLKWMRDEANLFIGILQAEDREIAKNRQ
jgi:uncharacterized protein (UPF0147 family)